MWVDTTAIMSNLVLGKTKLLLILIMLGVVWS